MSILPFTNKHPFTVHRPVAMLPLGGGNAAIGRWQCCHRTVYDGKNIMNGRKESQEETNKSTLKHGNYEI